jgi:hypothetical protein
MKTKKLLKKLKEILSAERKAQRNKYDSLKKVLKSLRTEKRRLKAELASTSDEQEKREIESSLVIVSEQRKKGLKVLKELKKEED